ncbi:MAG: AMP-binding protein [Pseudomonadota bacterium]
MTRPATEPRESVVHLLDEAARTAPDRLALVCGPDRLSYAEVAGAVTALAADLVARGIGGGHRVAMLMGNSADAAVAMFAVQSAGAQVVPLNPAYTTAELRPILADAAPSLIIHDADRAGLVRTAAPHVARRPVGPGSRLIGAQKAEGGLTLPPSDALSTLQYTGGTTGRAKGVNLTHKAVAINVAQRQVLVPALDGEAVLAVTPLFHVYATAMGLYLSAAVRGTLHLAQKFAPGPLLQTIARERIGFLSASPTAFLGFMRDECFASTDFSALRVASSGSAALPVKTLKRWEEVTGCPICEGYGQTEAGPVLTYNAIDGPRQPGTVGRAVPGTVVEIVDLDTGTRQCPPGEPGEIRARGPQIMSGYRNAPEQTAKTLRDGWLYTGDIGTLCEDGVLSIVDRKKELVISAGYNIYPREVEEVLFAHPGVADAAVIGIPDAYRGEALLAAVVPSDPGLDELSLRDAVAQHLTKYKWPREYRFLEALPKTAIGKTDKVSLRMKLASEAHEDGSRGSDTAKEETN